VLSTSRIAELAGLEGFADIANELAALALPGFRIQCVDGQPARGASKLGGLPDLPSGVRWPTPAWPGHEREPMAFVAQIALDGLDSAVWPGPREALLSFFCAVAVDYMGVDSGGSARILYLPAGESLERRAPPSDLSDELVLDEAAVTLTPEVSLPGIGVDVATALEPFGFGWRRPRHEQEDAYLRLQERVADEQGFPATRLDGAWATHHRLLGWPRQIQGDVLPELVHLHHEAEGRNGKDLDAEPDEWRLLLQIEDDPERLGVQFGDGGTLYFGLPERDIATGRFDRAEAITQMG
jgi:hypothetical protein